MIKINQYLTGALVGALAVFCIAGTHAQIHELQDHDDHAHECQLCYASQSAQHVAIAASSNLDYTVQAFGAVDLHYSPLLATPFDLNRHSRAPPSSLS